MHTMGAFVAFQPSFHSALAKFLADPEGESDPAKASQRWTVLSRFERHFNFHTNVSLGTGMRLLLIIRSTLTR